MLTSPNIKQPRILKGNLAAIIGKSHAASCAHLLSNGRYHFKVSKTEKKVVKRKKRELPSKWVPKNIKVPYGRFENRYFSFDVTPHLYGMLDAFAQAFIRKVTVCAAPQTTKTTFGHVACAWLTEFNPGNFLHVYPDEKTGVEILDERIVKLFSDSPKLKKHLTGRKDDIAKHKLRLRGSMHRIAWAGSLQSLASRSVKYWVADEVDKYNERPSKKETTTLNQLKLRGRTFESSGKGLVLSSTSTETGFIWVELTKETQAVFVYWSKCPYCGIEQLMDFTKDTFYWPKGEDGHSLDRMEIEAKKLARYICQEPGCQKMWDDDARNTAQRINMKHGWHLRTDNGTKGEEMFAYLRRERPIYIGFIVPSWISYFVSLSSVASAYLKCKDKNLSPEEQFAAYQDFQNSHRSLPWKIELQAQPVNKILEFCDDRPEGVLPGGEVVASLIGMVDTQDNGEFYMSIIAFGWGFQNDQWLVLRKHIHSFEEIVQYMWNSEYFDADGQRYVVEHVGIDMLGHRTKEVLEFCIQYEGLITPCFGSARLMTQPFAFSQREYLPGSDQPIPGGGVRAIRMNSKYYKDNIAIKLSQNPGSPGSIRLYRQNEVGEDYCKQLIAEARDEKGKWVQIGSRPNHYGDNLYGANCIADYLGVKTRIKPEFNVEDIELAGVQEVVVDL